ncbi:hypothetical protein BsWGS_26435 [Bradybaena similaris]
MGIGLSYLSFLMALSVGVTQILYQIDVKEEHKQEQSTMAVGWSRHLVITSSLAFFLGAFLSIIDYNKRIRFHQPGVQKRCSVSNKTIDTVNVSGESQGENYSHDQHLAESTSDVCVQGKRMLKTVHVARNTAAAREGLTKSVKNPSRRCHTPANNAGPILVGQADSGNIGRMVTHNGRDQQGLQDREGIAIVADALKRYNLTKVKKSELIDGRHCLPTVEEEKLSVETSRQAQKKGALTRQLAVTGDSGSCSDSSEHLCVSDRDRQDGHTDNIQNKSQPSCVKETDKKDNISQNYRRSSTVEHALLNVSQFLDKTVSGGNLIADYSFGANNGKQCFQNSAGTNSEKKSSCNPLGKWRKTANRNCKKNVEGSCPSLDSRSTDHPGTSMPGHSDDTLSRPNVAVVSASQTSHRRGSKFQEKLSSEQIKRNMILECLSRDLGKRKKRIRQ